MLANFYDYSKKIGEGSFGKVYIGEHRITKKEVAIKQNTDMPTFLLHESKILRNLQLIIAQIGQDKYLFLITF